MKIIQSHSKGHVLLQWPLSPLGIFSLLMVLIFPVALPVIVQAGEERKGDDFTARMRKGVEFYNRGKFVEAEIEFINLMNETARSKLAAKSRMPQILCNLAEVYAAKANYVYAEAYFKKALELREKEVSTGSGAQEKAHNFACTYNNIGMLKYRQRKYSEAVGYFRKALVLYDKAKESNIPPAVFCSFNLASCLANSGDWALAEPIYRSSLAKLEDLFGADHKYYQNSLKDFCSILSKRGRGQESKQLEQAAYFRSLSTRSLSSDWEKFMSAGRQALGLGDLAKAQIEFEMALRSIDALEQDARENDALEIGQSSNATEGSTSGLSIDPRVLISISELGRVYFAQEKILLAETMLRRAVKLDAKLFGVNDPKTIKDSLVLAEICASQGHYQESESLYNSAIDNLKEEKNPKRLNKIRSGLAATYCRQGKWSEAERLYREILAELISTESNQLDSPERTDLIEAYLNLANSLRGGKEFQEADQFYRQALDLAVGNEETMANILQEQAVLFTRSANYREADRIFAQLIQIRERLMPNKEALLGSLKLYAEMLRQSDRRPEALKVEQRIKALIGN